MLLVVMLLLLFCFTSPTLNDNGIVPPRLRKRSHGNFEIRNRKEIGAHKPPAKNVNDKALFSLFFSSNVSKLFSNLPQVYILPIKDGISKVNVQFGNEHDVDWKTNVDLFEILDLKSLAMNYVKHEQDILFYLWLKQKYHKTVWNQDKLQSKQLSKSDIFFVPTLIPQDTYSLDKDTWIQLDTAIGNMRKMMNMTLNHGFIAGCSHPNTLVALRSFYPLVRNVADLFILRVDGDNTLSNGRNIYIPYIVNVDMQDYHSYDEERKYLIMAACRETLFHKDNRFWRSLLYKQWHELAPKSNISTLLNHDEFDSVLANSEFCVVTPGDTTSSSKLYKALFYGCIPIIFISHYAQLPFYKFIRWSSFSIIVYKDVIYNDQMMMKLLHHVVMLRQNQSAFQEYRRNVELARNLFDYYRHEWPSVYHLTLLEVSYRSHYQERHIFIP